MSKVKFFITSDSIIERKAVIYNYDMNTGKRIKKLYVEFKDGHANSKLFSLRKGLYSFLFKITTRDRDSEFQVEIQSNPSEDLFSQKNPETFQAMGNVGTGQMPFLIV